SLAVAGASARPGEPDREIASVRWASWLGGGSLQLRWCEPHQQRSLRPRRQFCFARYASWLTLHVRRHPREVCPLSGGVMLQPLSDPLPVGVRFLPHPLPATLSARLTTHFPHGEGYGLTMFRVDTGAG